MTRRQSQAPQPSAAAIDEAVRRAISDLGESHFRPKSLGYGKREDGAKVGANNAVRVLIRLNGPGTYDVPHSLGSVPVACELKSVVSTSGANPPPHASATPVRMGEWTDTNCRVDIVALAGSLVNCEAEFIVKGE